MIPAAGNPPGRSRICFRIGTWASFRAAMLALLAVAQPPGAAAPPLAELALGGPDDWVTALIDAWAVVGDILSFYQERIANEGFLATATQPFSVAQLFQMIGFPLPTATAAETHLQLTVSKITGAGTPAGPGSMVIPAGSPVRSLAGQARSAAALDQLVTRLAAAGSAPGPSTALNDLERLVSLASGAPAPPTPPAPGAAPVAAGALSTTISPQVFETTKAVAVHPGWNSLQPWVRVRTEVQEVRGGTTELRLAGTATGLAVGQPILVTAEVPGEPPASATLSFVRILAAVTANRTQGYTLVQWADPLDQAAGSPPPPLEPFANPRVFAFGNQLTLFGAAAPDWGALPIATRRRFATIQGGLLRQVVAAGGTAWASASSGLPAEPLNALAATGGAIFAGMAASGVFVSTDGGESWRQASNGLARKSVQCLLATGPPGQVLAGTLGAVYRSTDGGQTWGPLAGGPPQLVAAASPPSPPSPAGIEVIPTNLPNTAVRALAVYEGLLIAGTDSGIFTYDGASWSQAADAAASPPAAAAAMALPVSAFARVLDDLDPRLFAAASEDVYESADGLTWSRMPPLPTAARPLRALAASGGRLFAGGWNGVYRADFDASPSGGWTLLTGGPPGPITVLSLLPGGTVNGADAALWAGTAQEGLWTSADLGESWTREPLPPQSPPSPAAVLALLAAAGTIFAATPFAGFAAGHWPGFAIQGRQVDLGKTDGKIVPGGRLVLYDPPRAGAYTIEETATVYRQGFTLNASVTRLTVTPEAGLAAFELRTTQAWVESVELELAVASVPVPTPVCGSKIELAGQLTAMLPPRQKLMLTGQPLNAALLPTGGVLRRQGESWAALGPRGAAVTALAVRGPELWAATAGEGVFQLAAGRLAPSNTGLGSSKVVAFAVSLGTLFAGAASGGVFRWDAGGAHWEAWGLAGEAVSALAADGAGTLYAATSTGTLFQSVPGAGAQDWQALPAPGSAVLRLAAGPASGQLYAGTAAGVFGFDGAAWGRTGAGLADLAVGALLWSDGRLVAGTLGAGVFQLEAAAWQPVGTAPGNGQVTSLAALPGGLAAGLAGSSGVCLWNGAGWQAAPTGISNSVQALAVADGELFAGTDAASLLESPGDPQALAVGTDRLFTYSPAPGELASLDQGNLPAGLTEAFTGGGTPLSPQAVVAPGVLGGFWIVQDTGNAVYYLSGRSATAVQVAAAGAVLQITGPPQPVPVPGSPAVAVESWPLADQAGVAGSLAVLPGELLLLPAQPGGATASEVAQLAAQLPIGGTAGSGGPTVRADDRQRTRLLLAADLSGFYDAATVSLSANVVHATNGQSVQEVLGSGDTSQPNQSFRTRRAPVIHLAAADGPRSTLALQVNGVPWREVPSLGQAEPGSRVYAVTYDAEGHATVTFGDGEHGATLPTGRDNVVAFYRGGSQGPEAEVEAGRLIQLLAPASRVQRITNPGPASRAQPARSVLGAAPPSGIRTLRRAVTPGDFASLLLAVPGVAQVRARRLWTGAGWLVGITVAATGGKPVLPGSQLERQLAAAVTDGALPGTAIAIRSFQPAWFVLGATLLVPPGLAGEARSAIAAAARSALAAAFGTAAGGLGEPVTAARITSLLQQIQGLAAVRIQALYRRGDPPRNRSTLPALDMRWDPRAQTLRPAELLQLDAQDGLTLALGDAP